MRKNSKRLLAALMCMLICGSAQGYANNMNITVSDPSPLVNARLGPGSSNPSTSVANRGNQTAKISSNQIQIKEKIAFANPQTEVFVAFKPIKMGFKTQYLPTRTWNISQLIRNNNFGYFQNVEVQNDGMSKVELTLPNKAKTITYVKTETISNKLLQLNNLNFKKLETQTKLFADLGMKKYMVTFSANTKYKILDERNDKKLICVYSGFNDTYKVMGWAVLSASSNNIIENKKQPTELLYVQVGNPLKNIITTYSSLTSGTVSGSLSINDIQRVEYNAPFLDIYVYDNGYSKVTYFNKQYKDVVTYVKTSDISTGSNLNNAKTLPTKILAADTPFYTDSTMSRKMTTLDAGRTYKVLGQQGTMQQIYSYGKGDYSAIGWINTSTTISSTGVKGDINGDGVLDSSDLTLLDKYLKNNLTAINKADADMNNDGIIDIVDYNYIVLFKNPQKDELKGDVNGDKKIDEADLNLLKQYLAGEKVNKFHHYSADMNGDKRINSTDLSQLSIKLNSLKPAVLDTYTVVNIANGWYEIAPMANTNMRLDVDGGREGNEVNIKIYNSNGNAAQKYYLNNVGNGYFTLQTGCNGYVDLKFGGTSNGSNIWQYEKEATNGKCQKFRAVRHNNDTGVYIEPILKEGMTIACANNSAAPQTNVVLWSRANNNYQKWKFIPTNAVLLPANVPNGLYSIQPQCSPNGELTVYGASKSNGAQIIIFSKNSQNHTQKSHQKWYVTKLNNGYYKITAENSGLALNNHNGQNTNGNPITLWGYSGFCQEFRFLDAGNGYYIIQPKGCSGVLDVSGGSSANNAKVQLYQYNYSAAQKWKLERRNPGKDIEPTPVYKEWSAWPKRNCDVFENANLTYKKGRVDTADPVTVIGENASAYHIRYKLTNGGTKDGWVTRDIFKDIPNNSLSEKLQNLKNKYPEGSTYNKNYCSDGYQAKECHGYALQLRIDLTGKNPMKTCNKIKSKNAINNLQAGDLVRYRNDGHTIIITAVNGNDVTYTDCNWNHDRKIRWNVHISKQELINKFHVYSGSNDYVMKYNG